MSCFSLAYIEQLCIYIVIVIAIWSIIKLLLPYVTQFMPAIVVQIISIVLWAIVAIICIYIIFGLIGCLVVLEEVLSRTDKRGGVRRRRV